MPHLVEMDQRYGKKGLQIIGAHVQQATDEEIEEKVKDLKIKFPVVKGLSGPDLANGIPHVAVFSVEGKLVYSGHPANPDFERTVKRELKSATATPDTGDTASSSLGGRSFLVDERSWTNTEGKQLRAALVSVSNGQGAFRKPNGQTFTYEIAKLSQADQDMIGKAQADTEENAAAE